MMEKKQGQAWSIDMIIAVVIFVLIISVLYAVLNREAETDIIDLQVEANNLATKIRDPNSPICNIINGTRIDEEALIECYQQNPEDIRQQLGIRSNFCIYIEDNEGRIIYVGGGESGGGRAGVGDNELIIGPTACGESVS